MSIDRPGVRGAAERICSLATSSAPESTTAIIRNGKPRQITPHIYHSWLTPTGRRFVEWSIDAC
jgi:hypothetical protein